MNNTPIAKLHEAKTFSFFEFVGRLSITVVASVIVPIIAGYVSGGNIAGIDKVLLGLLMFLVSSVVQLNIEVSAIKKQRNADLKLWDIREEIDMGLINIRKSFVDIVNRRNTLYRQYFAQRIIQLEQVISEAASASEELLVDQDSDTTEMMLQEFAGKTDHIIRFTHYFKDNDFLFDVHASQFFSEVGRKVSQGMIKEVRRLFVMTDESELSEARTVRLLQFHAKNPGFSYRVIPVREFERLKRDFRLAMDTHDFGIYGQSYVYCSKVSAAHEVKGIFISAESSVRRFTNFFDSCWTAQFASEVGLPTIDVMGLQELFGRSPVSPNRPATAQGDHLPEPLSNPSSGVSLLPQGNTASPKEE